MRGPLPATSEYRDVRNGFARDFLEVTDRITSFQWTIAEIKDLHLALSRAMNVESGSLSGLDAKPGRVASRTEGVFAIPALRVAVGVGLCHGRHSVILCRHAPHPE